MRADVVVDVGNTRIKWGLCSADAVIATASLPPDDPAAWQEQAQRWQLAPRLLWVLSGVDPLRRERLASWLVERGDVVHVVESPEQLPLQILLEHPQKVGIDRLLDAVAANARRRPGVAAVVIDAGSAVTVDRVDAAGAFRGGAILPGFRLMAKSLHDYTALLPCIEPPRGAPAVPGTSTVQAMQAGIFWAVAGGIRALVEQMAAGDAVGPDVFLTGGDAAVLRPVLGEGVIFWPEMTLEGIRRTAEALP
jgi:type III pantothenate kinase